MGNAISCTALLLLLLNPLIVLGDDLKEGQSERIQPVVLKRTSSINTLFVPECSGIVKSRKHAGLFWVHSDSGNPSVLYPIRSDGSLILPDNESDMVGSTFRDASTRIGIKLAGEENVDWEDITTDDRGNLIIADTGNNRY